MKHAVRVQYGALPYRFSHDAALEILLVTTRQSRQWIIPKGWPIKGLRPAKSAAREAFEEAGVRGRVGAKSIGLFSYKKMLDGNGVGINCEVAVFPLLWLQLFSHDPQVLTAATFAKIRMGMSEDEVRRLLGKPGQVAVFPLKPETVWSWKWREGGVTEEGIFNVHFDQNLKVYTTSRSDVIRGR